MIECIAATIIFIAIVTGETLLAQWLFNCFGHSFSFFETLGILIVADIVIGFFFRRR